MHSNLVYQSVYCSNNFHIQIKLINSPAYNNKKRRFLCLITLITAATGGALLAHHAVTAEMIDEMIAVMAAEMTETDEIETIAGVIDIKCTGLLRQLLYYIAGINKTSYIPLKFDF